MTNEHLAVYLNDHLAGSSTGLELVEMLQKGSGLEDWATQLRSDIAADRDELERLMRELQIVPGSIRQAAGWFAGKLAELKTLVDDPKDGALRRLEITEALALGIHGKQALWTALQNASERMAFLKVLDYPRLIARAEAQERSVEDRRVQAAVEAFGPR
jgi:hypothetical protein